MLRSRKDNETKKNALLDKLAKLREEKQKLSCKIELLETEVLVEKEEIEKKEKDKARLAKIQTKIEKNRESEISD